MDLRALPLVLVLLLALTALSGCLDTDEVKDSDDSAASAAERGSESGAREADGGSDIAGRDGTDQGQGSSGAAPNASDGPEATETLVHLTLNEDPPTTLTAGETLEINISARLDAGAPGTAEEANLYWSEQTTADTEPLTTTSFNGSSPAVPAQVPGNHSIMWTLETPGTYHIRAHVVFDGEHFWGEEFLVHVFYSGPAVTKGYTATGASIPFNCDGAYERSVRDHAADQGIVLPDAQQTEDAENLGGTCWADFPAGVTRTNITVEDATGLTTVATIVFWTHQQPSERVSFCGAMEFAIPDGTTWFYVRPEAGKVPLITDCDEAIVGPATTGTITNQWR